MTVPPEWEAPDVPTPSEINLTWSETAWAGTEYDAGILGTNDRTGYLGDYQPVVHYMSRADFESLGNTIDPDRIPTWTED